MKFFDFLRAGKPGSPPLPLPLPSPGSDGSKEEASYSRLGSMDSDKAAKKVLVEWGLLPDEDGTMKEPPKTSSHFISPVSHTLLMPASAFVFTAKGGEAQIPVKEQNKEVWEEYIRDKKGN